MQQLTKFSVILLVFIMTGTCRAKITIANPRLDQRSSGFVDAVINILTSCYGDRINSVVLAGDLPDALFRKLAARYLIPVVVINHTTRTTNNQYRTLHQFRQFRHKQQIFILGVYSLEAFINLMKNEVAPSIWWNHEGSFLILDLSPACPNPGGLLGIAWQIGILDVNVLCINRRQRRFIYNYNPYTSQAPATWKKFFVVAGIDNHPFTVFYRIYGKNEDICANLHFEKTNDLAGYKIRMFVRQKIKIAHEGSLETSDYHWKSLNRVFRIISSVLNATLIRNVRSGDILIESLDDLEQFPGCLIDVKHNLMTYPHDQTGLILISQFRGHKSQLNKILTVIDLASRFGMVVVYLITFIFLRLFLRQASMPAILNLVRITCDQSFTNLRDSTSARIYLASLLFFAVTMQGIYQGNLASLLTTQIPLRSVNTINDVVDLGYKVYGTKVLKLLIDNQDVIERFIEIDHQENCVEHAMNDSSGVCLGITFSFVIDQARELKLHVSNEVLMPLYIAFHIRWNWPLEQRFNIVIQRMVEADVLKPWPERFNETRLTEFEYDEKVRQNKDFKNIQLHEVAFAFVILGIGLVCATITFIGELALHKFRSRVVTARVEILN